MTIKDRMVGGTEEIKEQKFWDASSASGKNKNPSKASYDLAVAVL